MPPPPPLLAPLRTPSAPAPRRPPPAAARKVSFSAGAGCPPRGRGGWLRAPRCRLPAAGAARGRGSEFGAAPAPMSCPWGAGVGRDARRDRLPLAARPPRWALRGRRNFSAARRPAPPARRAAAGHALRGPAALGAGRGLPARLGSAGAGHAAAVPRCAGRRRVGASPQVRVATPRPRCPRQRRAGPAASGAGEKREGCGRPAERARYRCLRGSK